MRRRDVSRTPAPVGATAAARASPHPCGTLVVAPRLAATRSAACPPSPALTVPGFVPAPRVDSDSTWTTASIELFAATPIANTRVSAVAATGTGAGPNTTGPVVAVGTMSTV